MSGSFIAVALIAVVMLVYWRLTLLILVALMLAMLVSGLGWVSGVAAGATGTPPSVSVTVPSGQTPVQAGQPH